MVLTRRLLPILAVLIWDSGTFGQVPDADSVLAATRAALGSDKNLAAVKTFVATGRTRQLRGNNLVPIEFEISCELPDKYVRKDEFPAQDTDVTVSGFVGDELIVFPQPAAGRGGPPPAQRLTAAKQDFARLMLGAFAASFPSYPLTFKYAAEGEAPEGKADVLDVAGPAGFAARLVIQRDTHLPVMLIWNAPAPPSGGRGGAPRGGPPRGAAPPDAPPPATSPPAASQLRGAEPAGPQPENRLYFADYRDVKGTKWPFRIRRAVGGNTIEETTFDRINVNGKIDPKKFEVPK
jgi:hypothetical protein